MFSADFPAPDGDDELHGGDGELHVSPLYEPHPASRAFVDAAAGLGIPRNDDFNGARQDGFGLYQVTQKAGERWSAARAYLSPRPNLAVRTGALVEKIVVEDGRAVGVQASFGGKREVIRASGGVVLSAGAFGSPQVLMLSGIGPAAHLQDKGLPVLLDKAAVGEDLQDHIDFVASWETGSLDFLHTWINAGYKFTSNVSAGAHYELLSNTRAVGGNTAVVYQWVGPYVQFALKKGFFARFTAGADIEEGGDGDFYKLAVGMSF